MSSPAPRIVVSPEAAGFILEHGGRLFVWADDDGLKHVKFHPPDHRVDFVQLPCEGRERRLGAGQHHGPAGGPGPTPRR